MLWFRRREMQREGLQIVERLNRPKRGKVHGNVKVWPCVICAAEAAAKQTGIFAVLHSGRRQHRGARAPVDQLLATAVFRPSVASARFVRSMWISVADQAKDPCQPCLQHQAWHRLLNSLVALVLSWQPAFVVLAYIRAGRDGDLSHRPYL